MRTAKDRYVNVNALWADPVNQTDITPDEARCALAKILSHFGRRNKDFPAQRRNMRFRHVRRVWISKTQSVTTNRGWPRLVHDLSHLVFAVRYPGRRPHDPIHAKVELEIAQYVVDSGWLNGHPLRPKSIDRSLTQVEVVTAKAEHAAEMLAEHLRKLKREQTLVRRWKKRVAYYKALAAKRSK